MARQRRSSPGFTLVEIIASLVLVGLMASVTGLFLVSVMKSYETATMAAEGALKAQVAIDRIYIELMGIDSDQGVTVTTNTSIAYRHAVLTPTQNRALTYNSSQNRIELTVGSDTYPLVDDVATFSLTATGADIDDDGSDEIAYVDIAFTLSGIASDFSVRVFPRHLDTSP